jgi:tetratricopeptide (TPR) repeat protein
MAIKHYNEAIRRDPKLALAYTHRGEALATKGKLESAVKDYNQAIKIDPKHPVAYNNLAWLQATYPDERFRNGKQAVENAKKACELTEWKVGSCFDTLAGAYAEAGDFPNAIKWQQKALAQATQDAEKQEMQKHLKQYQAGKPYREEPKK